jgi:HPt (histidine-containing phosphotransfer) domain-containing protein
MTEVFDRQELLEELDGDREFLEESLDMLDTDAPTLIGQIHAGIDGNDAEKVRIAAHTIKSMVGNFCATPAFEAALKVETIGSSGDLAECAAGLQSLEDEVNRLRRELRKFLDEL